MPNVPHELTVYECREDFVRSVWELLRECRDYDDPRKTCGERMETLAFSFLALLGGGYGVGWVVAPAPHPDDQEYCISQGENWYPEAPEIACDITSGDKDLADYFYQYAPEEHQS